MRILVLGGTSFVGRAIVEDALRAGAEVTLFGFSPEKEEAVLSKCDMGMFVTGW